MLQVIQQKPNRFQIITWLHKNLSLPGFEPAVCFFELDGNNKIRPRHIVGFDGITLEQLPPAKLEDNRPVSNVLREMKMVVYGEEELMIQNIQLTKESNDLSFRQSGITKWKSVVGIPIGTNKGYSILLQHDVTKIDFALEHLRLLEALLNTYENLVQVSSTIGANNNVDKNLLGRELTNRQKEILSLVEAGRTNLQIALHLGYTHS